jgi:L-ribulose-5-phosphate 4-epimerase
MNEEGVIKYNCTWISGSPVSRELITELNKWREILYKAGLLGVNKEGIGYGNISCRFQHNNFIITGSGTGSISQLNGQHYTRVTAYSFGDNSLTTEGPVRASSESLTHAAVYESLPEVRAVFHVHHFSLWERLLESCLATSKEASYGTPAMAAEIIRLIKDSGIARQGILAMGGHEEGILCFGSSEDEAGTILMKWLEQL